MSWQWKLSWDKKNDVAIENNNAPCYTRQCPKLGPDTLSYTLPKVGKYLPFCFKPFAFKIKEGKLKGVCRDSGIVSKPGQVAPSGVSW